MPRIKLESKQKLRQKSNNHSKFDPRADETGAAHKADTDIQKKYFPFLCKVEVAIISQKPVREIETTEGNSVLGPTNQSSHLHQPIFNLSS